MASFCRPSFSSPGMCIFIAGILSLTNVGILATGCKVIQHPNNTTTYNLSERAGPLDGPGCWTQWLDEKMVLANDNEMHENLTVALTSEYITIIGCRSKLTFTMDCTQINSREVPCHTNCSKGPNNPTTSTNKDTQPWIPVLAVLLAAIGISLLGVFIWKRFHKKKSNQTNDFIL
ncbi:hypothetical protein UPYG_G00156590 [Umbra pygmaea]|uniref:Uncharacterized protein n=1 Tax=Umbra pygmaea TaxID=75934 RepID=A0ABD0X2H4_UMBPY